MRALGNRGGIREVANRGASRGARRGIKAQSGFTLVELIVVIVVMGLISLSAAAILRDSSEFRIPD